jgi:hypothetical protein
VVRVNVVRETSMTSRSYELIPGGRSPGRVVGLESGANAPNFHVIGLFEMEHPEYRDGHGMVPDESLKMKVIEGGVDERATSGCRWPFAPETTQIWFTIRAGIRDGRGLLRRSLAKSPSSSWLTHDFYEAVITRVRGSLCDLCVRPSVV